MCLCMKFVASFSGLGGCDGQRHPSLADGKMPSLRDGRGMQAHCYRPAGQARVRLKVLSVAKNSIVPFQRNVSCVSVQTGTLGLEGFLLATISSLVEKRSRSCQVERIMGKKCN